MRFLRWFAFAALVLSAGAALGKDEKTQADALLSFVVGDYVIVGREPDGGAPYAGTARIEPRTGGLLLNRRRGQHEVTAIGRLEVPSPPNEGRVLRFRWYDPEPVLMTCLVSADLDNYPRLTCYWLHEGTQPSPVSKRCSPPLEEPRKVSPKWKSECDSTLLSFLRRFALKRQNALDPFMTLPERIGDSTVTC